MRKASVCMLLVCLSVSAAAPLTLNELDLILQKMLAAEQAKLNALSGPSVAAPPTTQAPATPDALHVADELIRTGESLILTLANETEALHAQALGAAEEADKIEMAYELIGGEREKYMELVGDRLVALEKKMFDSGDVLEDMSVKVQDFFSELNELNTQFKDALNAARAAEV